MYMLLDNVMRSLFKRKFRRVENLYCGDFPNSLVHSSVAMEIRESACDVVPVGGNSLVAMVIVHTDVVQRIGTAQPN